MTYTRISNEQPFVSFTPVDDSMSLERMLQISRTEFLVGLAFLAATYPKDVDLRNLAGNRLYFHELSDQKEAGIEGGSGSLPPSIAVRNGSHLGTIATFPTGDRKSLGVVGSRYTVIQNSQVLEEALKVASNLGSPIQAVGTNQESTRFAVKFAETTERIIKYNQQPEDFVRSLFAYSSHDGSYAYSYAFQITDPENRVVASVIVKRKHTAKIAKDKALQTLLTDIAEASKKIIDDIRLLAVLQVESPQLEAGLKLLSKVPSVATRNDGDDDSGDDDSDARPPKIERGQRDLSDRIRAKYVEHQSRYGATAWALYEAWIDVAMAEDQRQQQVAFEKKDSGLVLLHLTKRSRQQVSEYSVKRRQLLRTLSKKQ
jgi:hypothetical protein